MNFPSRGGVRGGADQFGWDSVKTDKHRENYLGHSLMAPVGRWQKGKDLSWFSKANKDTKATQQKMEVHKIKQMEEEAMAAALGFGTVKKKASGLTKQEVVETLKRGQTERDSGNVERIEGMGFGSSRAAMMDTNVSSEGFIKSTQLKKQKVEKDENTTDKEEDESKRKKKKHKEKKSKKTKDEGYSRQRDLERKHSDDDDDLRNDDKSKSRINKSKDKNSEKSYYKRERHDTDSEDEDRYIRKNRTSKDKTRNEDLTNRKRGETEHPSRKDKSHKKKKRKKCCDSDDERQ